MNNVEIPKSYIFLKSVGRALVAVRPKQEQMLTIENFLSESCHPAVTIMDIDIESPIGSAIREPTLIMKELKKEVKEVQKATGTLPEPSISRSSTKQEHLFDDQNYAEQLREVANKNVMDRLSNIDESILRMNQVLANLGEEKKNSKREND